MSDNNSNNKNNKNKKNKNNEEEKVYVLLKLNKNIAQILRIFAKHYDEGDVDNLLSSEVTKIIEALATDPSGPAQEPFPDSLKQHVKNLWKNYDYNNNNK